MNKSYGFELDTDNCIQLGDTRLFEIKVDKESINRFIIDLQLFENKASQEEE